MPSVFADGRSRQLTLLGVSVLFTILLVFGGGASRGDALSQPIVWLASILALAVTVGTGALPGSAVREMPFALLLTCALLVVVQLIPLPPAIWTLLPGREIYADVAVVSKIAQPWRPISLTPDLGWNSFLSLLPPLAAAATFTTIGDARGRTIDVLLAVGLLSAILGLAQISGGSGGPLRFYAVTNNDSAVGLFANRNHQALLLVICLPALAAWSRLGKANRQARRFRSIIALLAGFFILPMVLATGSRAGAVLALLALAASALMMLGSRGSEFEPRVYKDRPGLLKWVAIGLGLIASMAAVLIVRSPAVDRLFASNALEEQRTQLIAPLTDMALAFFPFGSGFGSFDATYRAFEPDSLLTQTYMNQAHNDLAQLFIEGGIFGVAILIWLLIWVTRRSMLHWKQAQRLSSARLMGRLGSVVVTLILAASLVDYPLRTPLGAVLLTIGLLWLAGEPVADRDRQGSKG